MKYSSGLVMAVALAMGLMLVVQGSPVRADNGPSVSVWLGSLAAAAGFDPHTLMRMPKKPWVVWYQCPFWEDVKHANVDASSGEDAARKESARGICSLLWSYGIESPYAKGMEYFRDQFIGSARDGYAGTAMDEWSTPPIYPAGGTKAEKWCAAGLRAFKKMYPHYFVAVWVTRPTPIFRQLVRDGTIDLALIEGYSFVPDHPEWAIPFKNLIKDRVELMKREGLLSKTIVCVGELSAKPDKYGKHMTDLELVREVRYIAHHYPEMPGIAFYGVGDHNYPGTRGLVRLADRLSAYYYPLHK